jgi:hypothetical protein
MGILVACEAEDAKVLLAMQENVTNPTGSRAQVVNL